MQFNFVCACKKKKSRLHHAHFMEYYSIYCFDFSFFFCYENLLSSLLFMSNYLLNVKNTYCAASHLYLWLCEHHFCLLHATWL